MIAKAKIKKIAGIVFATTARKVVVSIAIAVLGLVGLHEIDPVLVGEIIGVIGAIVQVAL